MEKIFVDGHGWCEVWSLPKVSPKKQREGKYIGESFVHPAKMDVVLCHKIIETYTEPGETVLDPMAGIDTTGVEAAYMGRNSIAVELEEKFVKITEQNIGLLEKAQTLTPKGKAVVIKGDSRELSRILREKADKVIFSPPYRERYAYKNPEERQKDDPTASKRNRIHKPYSQDPNNIGNLKYGKPVDAIVTSPPFNARTPSTNTPRCLSKTHGMDMIRKQRAGYPSRKGNIGNLPYKSVDAIVTSPPFKTSEKGAGIARRWHTGKVKPEDIACKGYRPISRNRALVGMSRTSDDPGNISNMPYGRVDAIVTSPPYADTPLQDYATSNKALLSFERKVRESFREKGYYEFNGKRYTEREWRRINKGELKPRGMPELWRQIISKRKGSRYSEIAHVDSVIFSPPYSESLTGKRDVEKEIAGWEKRQPNHPRLKTLKRRTEKGSCFVTRDYSQSNKNIGNLPHGKVDAVITSPPYSESMSKRRKGYTTHPELSKTRHMGEGSSDENIGNLKHGKIDAVITSPPYSESIGTKGGGTNIHFKQHVGVSCRNARFYSKDTKNIGNLPHGKVDAIVTSPPYEKSISKRGREEPRERIADRLRKAGFSEEYIKRYFTDNPSDNKMKGMGIHDAYSTDPSNIGNLRHGQVDAIVTSPPYQETMSTKRHDSPRSREISADKRLYLYPRSEENIGSKKGETYLQAMFSVYRECLSVLKQGGRMVLVLKDFVRNKKVVRLDLDTKRLCETVGFRWVETKLFRLPRKSFWRTLYERKYPEVDTSLLRFEFCEVFEKPLEARA